LLEGLKPGAPCEYVGSIGTAHQVCVDCAPRVSQCPLCRAPMRGGRDNVAPPSYYVAQARHVLNRRSSEEQTLLLQRLRRSIDTLIAAQHRQVR
jgi:hypothetical protein